MMGHIPVLLLKGSATVRSQRFMGRYNQGTHESVIVTETFEVCITS